MYLIYIEKDSFVAFIYSLYQVNRAILPQRTTAPSYALQFDRSIGSEIMTLDISNTILTLTAVRQKTY